MRVTVEQMIKTLTDNYSLDEELWVSWYSREEFDSTLDADGWREVLVQAKSELDSLEQCMCDAICERVDTIVHAIEHQITELSTIPCPKSDGGYDCTPFCPSCEGNQEVEVN